MADYSQLGLNANLMPANAPIAQNNGAISPYMFDANNDRSSISGAKLRNFSFNAGTGGTIVLGGQSNQNGLLQIKDASGSVVVTGNNTGLTIQDSRGTTIIDATGLVSSANFPFQTATINSGSTTSSVELDPLNYAPVPGGTLTLSRIRTTNFLIGFTINSQNNKNGEPILFQTLIGTVTYGPVVINSGFWGTLSPNVLGDQAASANFIVSLPVGTSNLVLGYATFGAGTAIVDGSGASYFAIQLGN